MITQTKTNLTLRLSQRAAQNEWRCTLGGKERLLTSREVQFYTKTLEEAVSYFRPEECEKVIIESEFPQI
jgi:hypothetical protein